MSDIRFCRHCRKPLLPDSRFCSNCGNPVEDESQLDEVEKKAHFVNYYPNNEGDGVSIEEKASWEGYEPRLEQTFNDLHTKGVCTVCGYVHEGSNIPDKCPLCKRIGSFIRINSPTEDNWPNLPVVGVESAFITCYHCGKPIPRESVFCPVCRTKLYTKCPNCGQEYSSQYENCLKCGTNFKEFLEQQEQEKQRQKKEDEEKRRIAELKKSEEERKKRKEEEEQRERERIQQEKNRIIRNSRIFQFSLEFILRFKSSLSFQTFGFGRQFSDCKESKKIEIIQAFASSHPAPSTEIADFLNVIFHHIISHPEYFRLESMPQADIESLLIQTIQDFYFDAHEQGMRTTSSVREKPEYTGVIVYLQNMVEDLKHLPKKFESYDPEQQMRIIWKYYESHAADNEIESKIIASICKKSDYWVKNGLKLSFIEDEVLMQFAKNV